MDSTVHFKNFSSTSAVTRTIKLRLHHGLRKTFCTLWEMEYKFETERLELVYNCLNIFYLFSESLRGIAGVVSLYTGLGYSVIARVIFGWRRNDEDSSFRLKARFVVFSYGNHFKCVIWALKIIGIIMFSQPFVILNWGETWKFLTNW